MKQTYVALSEKTVPGMKIAIGCYGVLSKKQKNVLKSCVFSGLNSLAQIRNSSKLV